MKLSVKQTKALDFLQDRVTNEVFYGGAGGGGKTVLGCYWQLKNRIKYPGSRGLIGRSVLKILKDTTLKTLLEVAKLQGLIRGTHFDLTGPWDKENPNCIIFSNGSLIFLRDLAISPSDPDMEELGGLEVTDAFVDEGVPEKAVTILKVRIRYKLDEFNLIPKILYASNPVKTWPYYQFYKPAKQGILAKNKQFIQAFVHDNPMVSKSYVDSLINMEEGPTKQRLYYGNWEYSDDAAALINYDAILECFKPNIWEDYSHITADIARFGKDSTVIGVWQGYNVQLYKYDGLSITQSAEQIIKFQEKYNILNSNTIVDEDGVGAGVVDILGCRGFINNSRPLSNPISLKPENFINLKSQCYFKLAELINQGKIKITTDHRSLVIEELENVRQWNMDKDTKLAIIPKDKIKELIGRSPDFSDCLALRAWY